MHSYLFFFIKGCLVLSSHSLISPLSLLFSALFPLPFIFRYLSALSLLAFFSPPCPFCRGFSFFLFSRFVFFHRVGIFFSLLLSCYKSSTKKLARSRFLGFQEKVKVATLYYIVLQFYLFFLKAKKLLAKGKSTLPNPLTHERV